MSVWLTMPSARPPAEANPVLQQWRDMGYKIALWRDDTGEKWMESERDIVADFVLYRDVYPGYANSVNTLVEEIMTSHADAEWFVAAGDDTLPDPNQRADRIAEMCRFHLIMTSHANAEWFVAAGDDTCRFHFEEVNHGNAKLETFGVMQPTGDRWHEGLGGFANAPIDRVAGSAWIGREFARRAYGGNGPLWPGYTHMYVDEELQCVAEKLGVFWQRRDLVQRHQHWGRGATDRAVVNDPQIPPHLVKWNTPEHWNKSKALFMERKAAGFPGHEVR